LHIIQNSKLLLFFFIFRIFLIEYSSFSYSVKKLFAFYEILNILRLVSVSTTCLKLIVNLFKVQHL